MTQKIETRAIKTMPHLTIKLWPGKLWPADETRLVIVKSDNCKRNIQFAQFRKRCDR
jgi:hypothetical protein